MAARETLLVVAFLAAVGSSKALSSTLVQRASLLARLASPEVLAGGRSFSPPKPPRAARTQGKQTERSKSAVGRLRGHRRLEEEAEATVVEDDGSSDTNNPATFWSLQDLIIGGTFLLLSCGGCAIVRYSGRAEVHDMEFKMTKVTPGQRETDQAMAAALDKMTIREVGCVVADCGAAARRRFAPAVGVVVAAAPAPLTHSLPQAANQKGDGALTTFAMKRKEQGAAEMASGFSFTS